MKDVPDGHGEVDFASDAGRIGKGGRKSETRTSGDVRVIFPFWAGRAIRCRNRPTTPRFLALMGDLQALHRRRCLGQALDQRCVFQSSWRRHLPIRVA